VLRAGSVASDALKAELQQHVRKRLGLHAYPREIEFISELPKTPSDASGLIPPGIKVKADTILGA
jgi:acyl-coenzyme A synthetase/AMP-(fatty) acid ligase